MEGFIPFLIFMWLITFPISVFVQSTVPIPCLIQLLCRIMACHVAMCHVGINLRGRNGGFFCGSSRFGLAIIVLMNSPNYIILSISLKLKFTAPPLRFSYEETKSPYCNRFNAVIITFIAFQPDFFLMKFQVIARTASSSLECWNLLFRLIKLRDPYNGAQTWQ